MHSVHYVTSCSTPGHKPFVRVPLYSVGLDEERGSEAAPTILVLATIYTRQQHTGSHGMRAY